MKIEIESLMDYVIGGLLIDGEHHKQWYLEEILKIIVGDKINEVRGRLQKEDYDWEDGIAP